MNALATKPNGRHRDPFEGVDGPTVRALLTAKGWPAAALSGTSETDALLGADLVAVVSVGADGDAALDRVTGAHGELPRTPTFTRSGGRDGEVRTVRLFRTAPARDLEVGGLVLRDTVPTAENLHGHVGGVSVVAEGTQPLPPRNGHAGVWARWTVHPTAQALALLPAWLADAARDPVAAGRLATTVRPTASSVRELAAWEATLVRAGRRTANTFGNVMKIFRDAPCYAGRFRLNLMTQGVEFEGRHLPEGRLGAFREQIEDAPWGGFAPGEASVMQAIRSLAEERAHHPVQAYLKGLVWDGVPRLDLVATELLHADPDPLTVTMVRRWFIGAVARALDPGCQVDHALVLVGGQGLKKSSFFRALAGEWFGDTEIRIGDKDAYGQIHATWVTEWGELDRITSQRHAGEVKAFVSRRADTFRPPYGRTTGTYPRSCVIVGSTNENEFLSDPTGSRRFWVVRVPRMIDAALVGSLRDALWAEAVAAYLAGEMHYLRPEEDLAREVAAEQYRVRDAWEEVVESWLDGKWSAHRHETGEKFLTTQAILRKALGLEPRDMDRGVTMRLGRVMAALGYATQRKRVPRGELGLYRTTDGEVLKLLHAWEPKEGGAPPTDALPAEGSDAFEPF